MHSYSMCIGRCHSLLLFLCAFLCCTLSRGSDLDILPSLSVGLNQWKKALATVSSAAVDNPPAVPHDGIKVVPPLDSELSKCPAGGSSKVSNTLVQQHSFGTPLSTLRESWKVRRSFLQASPQTSAQTESQRHRTAFVCAAGCGAHEPQLEESLSPWADWRADSSGLDMMDAIEGFCNARRESDDPFVMAVLWQGDVYLKTCQAESVKTVSLYLIGPEDLSLVLIFLFGAQRIGHLPAGPIAFGMYLSDYSSLLDRHLVGPGLPIFAYLGRDTSWIVPWPSSFTLMATQDVETIEHKDNSHQKPWEEREAKAFWIGSVTGPWEFALDDGIMSVPRMKLLKLSKDHPEELHAEWSSTAGYGISWVKDGHNVSGFLAQHSRSVEELTGIPKSDYKKVEDWENYKYYVNLDGVVMGGRLNKLLSLGGVVLQHQAGYKENINALVKPYEHYVPIEYDLSDLVEKVQWLQQNEAEAKRIAENGKALALKRMRFEDHVCYVWRALEALGKKTASAQVSESEVEKRLESYVHVTLDDAGMRQTLEKFWGEKLEEVKTGDRKMSKRGIELLQWSWDRMAGLYNTLQSNM